MKRLRIRIGHKNISFGSCPFIIAEAGVNHNGRLDFALRLIDIAATAGADAVKFQTFKAEEVATEQADMADYQKNNLGQEESQLAMLKKLELKEDFYHDILEHCHKKNIIFLSTPHNFASIDFLQKLKVPAFKFGSGDLTNLPVLEYTAQLGKPMILGTGMATMQEIKNAIQCIKKSGNDKIIVLHCTTNYPCPFDEVNLSAIQSMIKELGVLVGYSDHTLGIQVPIMAAVLGACIIEKHFTLDKTMLGPDHKISLNPEELVKMIHQVRLIKTILGTGIKKPAKSEKIIAKTVRKSLVASRDINQGEVFSSDNIQIKRPGIGLAPKLYKSLLGKRAKTFIKSDMLLKPIHYE